MLAIVLFVIVCVFAFAVMPDIGIHKRPDMSFVIFLFGIALIWLVLRTKIVEEITSIKFLQIIIKIMLTIAGVAIIWFGLNIN